MRKIIAAVTVGALLLIPLLIPFTVAAGPGGMTTYVPITIDHTQVDADLTDFPVYVDLSEMPSGFWSTVTSDCGDIRVTKDDGTTELAREVVSCDTTAETGELHFKYDGTLSSTVDTTVRIYYDGSSSDYATTATYGRNAVWSHAYCVLHMSETSGNTLNDSTGNGCDGTANQTLSADYIGPAGYAFDLDSDSQYALFPEFSRTYWEQDLSFSILTYSTDVNTDSSNAISFYSNANVKIRNDPSNGKLRMSWYDTSFTENGLLANHSIDTWYHHSFRRDKSGGLFFYQDGTLVDSRPSNTRDPHPTTMGNKYAIGIYSETNTTATPWDGAVSSFRFYDYIVSEQWLATESNNLLSFTNFATVGAETSEGGGAEPEDPTYPFVFLNGGVRLEGDLKLRW